MAMPPTPRLVPLTLISPVPGTITEWGSYVAVVAHATFIIRDVYVARPPTPRLVPLTLISLVPGTISE